MDSSDGLARSLHQLAEASGCGFAIEAPLPIDPQVDTFAETEQERRDLGVFFGEDFELVCTLPESDVLEAREATPCPLHRIGTVTEDGVTLNGEPLPDQGYSH
jgi:thiamine-monophosphate kinase